MCNVAKVIESVYSVCLFFTRVLLPTEIIIIIIIILPVELAALHHFAGANYPPAKQTGRANKHHFAAPFLSRLKWASLLFHYLGASKRPAAGGDRNERAAECGGPR